VRERGKPKEERKRWDLGHAGAAGQTLGSLDLRTLRSLLVLLKEGVDCLIERTNLGLGTIGLENGIGHIRAIAVEPKPNPTRRASSKPASIAPNECCAC
jgi:hypothetical protein